MFNFLIAFRFKFGIHEQGSMAYALSKSLKAGYKYIIEFSITQTKERDLANLDPSQRGCLLASENPSPLYVSYSQPNCLVQCKMRELSKKCGCLPWEFTVFSKMHNTTICESLGQGCFLTSMTNTYCQESCPVSCATNSYTLSQTVEKLNYEQECNYLNEQGMPKDMPRWSYLLRPSHSNIIDIWDSHVQKSLYPCVTIMRGTSIVEVRPATGRVTTISQRPRRSFADQLAAFGNCYLI
jgi:hypothetical protein